MTKEERYKLAKRKFSRTNTSEHYANYIIRETSFFEELNGETYGDADSDDFLPSSQVLEAIAERSRNDARID